MPEPYNPDVRTWPSTDITSDLAWGISGSAAEPLAWLPTADCLAASASRSGWIGLPMLGCLPDDRYYTASPGGSACSGFPAETGSLRPGEGYWLDVERQDVWMRMLAAP
jgi:hypothetical protein